MTVKIHGFTIYRISSISTAISISTPVQYIYYLNTNNIDIGVIFIISAPSNSTACRLATLGIMANYCITMIILSIDRIWVVTSKYRGMAVVY